MKRRSFLLGSLAAAATPAVALPSAGSVLKEDMESRRAFYESALKNGVLKPRLKPAVWVFQPPDPFGTVVHEFFCELEQGKILSREDVDALLSRSQVFNRHVFKEKLRYKVKGSPWQHEYVCAVCEPTT